MSQQAISLMLHIQRKTVRRFLRAGQYPERATPHRRPPGINKYQESLLRRWGEGCHNATKLWHEIQDQGYTGGRSTMAKFIATLRVPGTTYFRTTAEPRQKKAKPPSPRQAAMLLARRPEKLIPAEQELLAKLNDCCPEIPILYDLAQGFAAVFRGKPLNPVTGGCRNMTGQVGPAGTVNIRPSIPLRWTASRQYGKKPELPLIPTSAR